MKKVILIIITVLFIFSITSCTSQSNVNQENVTTSEPNNSASTKADESDEIS